PPGSQDARARIVIQNSRFKMQKTERRVRDVFAFCILTFALLSSVTACSDRGAPHDPQVITVAVRSGPTTLHPRQGNDESSQRVAQLVFSPLMQWGDDLRVH